MKKARKHPTQQTTPRKKKPPTTVKWGPSPDREKSAASPSLNLNDEGRLLANDVLADEAWTQAPQDELNQHDVPSLFSLWGKANQDFIPSEPGRVHNVQTESVKDPLLVALEKIQGAFKTTSSNTASIDASMLMKERQFSGSENMRIQASPSPAQSNLSDNDDRKTILSCHIQRQNPQTTEQPAHQISGSSNMTKAEAREPPSTLSYSQMARDLLDTSSTVRTFHGDSVAFQFEAFATAEAGMPKSLTDNGPSSIGNASGAIPLQAASFTQSRHFINAKVIECISLQNVSNSSEGHRRLLVRIRRREITGRVDLIGRWSEAPVCVGDSINVILSSPLTGALPEGFAVVVDDTNNFLIIRPDVLVCPTRIADANSCLRKVVLSERLAIDMPSKDTMIGHMKHSLFEAAIVAGRFDEEFLFTTIKDILTTQRSVEDMFRLEVCQDDAAAELEKAVRSFVDWGRMMMGMNSPGLVLEFGYNQARLVRIVKVLATEETIWSPMWGLKGALDVTAVVSLCDSSGSGHEERIVMPLELKTGRVGGDRAEHRAQVMLYSLLLADRYSCSPKPRTEAGLLLQAPSMAADGSRHNVGLSTRGVRNNHLELRELMMIRNRIAVNTSSNNNGGHTTGGTTSMTMSALQNALGDDGADERERLPGVIGNVSGECSRCFQKDACSLVHVALDGGSAASLNFTEDEYKQMMGSLSHEHLAYYSRWYRILDCEGKENVTSQREIWTLDAIIRETKRSCISSLGLHVVPSEASTSHSSGVVLEFLRIGAKPIPLSETHIQIGDLILISCDKRQLAVGKGHVISLSSTTLQVRAISFPILLSPELIASSDWCVDKLEVMWGNRFLQGSLASLFIRPRVKRSDQNMNADGDSLTNETGRTKERVRSLIVDLKAPAFFDPDIPGKRNIRDCDPNLLQRALETCLTLEDVRRALSAKRIIPTIANAPSERADKLRLSVLTRDQITAVMATLAAKDYLCIIGAPGAGKSTTIAFIVHMLHELGKSVLVSSFTHAACDNLLLKIKERGVDVLRIGMAGNVHKEMQSSSLPLNCSVAVLEKHLKDPRLVCGATCLGVKHALIQRKKFDFCILDEAGQLAEPYTLGPFARAKTILLVGDPQQLPPLVVSREAKQLGMEVSLFERFVERYPYAVVSLTTQFRMNRDINTLANELFYRGSLSCGSEEVANNAIRLPHFERSLKNDPSGRSSWLFASLDPSRSVVFLNTDGLMPLNCARESRVVLNKRSSADSASQDGEEESFIANDMEVRIVSLLVDRLMRSGMPLRNIGVISPYRSQLRSMRKLLVDAVEVDTVDKFQGRDKDCIVISLVRSNPEKNVGSLLSDWRRLNVAFTRAKNKLIIIGSASTLTSPKFCPTFLPAIRRHQWMVELRGDDVSRYPDPGARRAGLTPMT